MIGTTQSILVMNQNAEKQSMLVGRTENNRTVTFKGDPSLIGEITKVLITSASTYALEGDLSQ